jgi:nitrogen fixation protein FixH
MPSQTLRGIHVLWMLLAFFALIIAVDAYFIFRAVATFPGEQVKNSYVLGLDFNREVERRERQRTLGWRAEAGVVQDDGQHLLVHLTSAEGRPLSGLAVSVELFSAAMGPVEETIVLEERGPGDYVAPVVLPAQARVEMNISAQRSGDSEPAFEAVKVLVTP